MKKQLLLIIAIIFLTLLCRGVYATEESGETQTLLNEYASFYGSILQSGIEDANDASDIISDIPDFSAEEIIKQLNTGELKTTPREVLEYLLRILLGEVYTGFRLLAIVLALSVLSTYLGGLKSGFGGDAVYNCAFYVSYIIIAGVASSAFYEAATCASKVIEAVAFFMRVLLPVIITALMTSGATVSAAVLEPALMSIVEIAVWLIESIFIPAVMISTALNIVNGISEKFKTDKMVKLLNNGVKWGLTVLLIVFVSLAGLKSIASTGVDGLAVKLSKFAAANLVPVVGGILAESVETIMNCSAVIKNSVGIIGIIGIIIIATRPVLKLAALLILFRITAAVTEPIADDKVTLCISRLADSISVLFSMVTAVSVMFVMIVAIIINAGNTAIMLGR